MSWQIELIKGSIWVLGISHSLKLISLASTIILARLLTPSDFGIVAMAMAVIAFVEMLGDFGFNIYLVQKEDLSPSDLDSAWTVQVLLGFLQGGILIAIASPVADIYNEPRLVNVFYTMAIIIICGGWRNIGVVYFHKDMRFHMEFMLRVPAKVIGILVSVAMGLWLRNYWAMVAGIGVQRITEVITSYIISAHRPRFSWRQIKPLMNWSKWVYWNTTLSFLTQRLPDLMIGKFLGTHQVGTFSVSQSLATLPTSELSDPIARATFPSFVKLRGDVELFQEAYLKVLGTIAFVTIPLGVWIAANASILVSILLGTKWMDAVPILTVLSLGAALKTQQSNTGSVFLAQGRPFVVTKLLTVRVVLMIGGLTYAILKAGILGAAWSLFCVELIMTPTMFFEIRKSLRVSYWAIYRCFVRPVVSSCVMWAFIIYTKPFIDKVVNGSTIGALVCNGLTGFLIYFSCIYGMWFLSGRESRSTERWVLNQLKNLSEIV